MRGYLNRPEETAKTLATAGCTPATSASSTRTASCVIVDRIKDMIIRGGENIYPKEIETALYGHEGVLEAAVVGRPDDVLGEVVVAYVALRPGTEVSVDQLHDLSAEQLAKYKRPVLIEVLDALPKNPVGKIDKPALRARATA